jgi:hypothetical protein
VEARRRGSRTRKATWSASFQPEENQLSAALEAAVPEGKLVRNVARLVSPPAYIKRERETWSKAEVRKFLAMASSDRLYAAWRLSPYACAAGTARTP